MFVIVDIKCNLRVFGPFSTEEEAVESVRHDYLVTAGWPAHEWEFVVKNESIQVWSAWPIRKSLVDDLKIVRLQDKGFRSHPGAP